MKIYLDIVYLIHVYIGCLCLLSISILNNCTITAKRLLLFSCLWGFISIGLYVPLPYCFFGLYSAVYIRLYVQDHFFKNYAIWLFLYFTYTISFLSFGESVYRRGPLLFVGTSFTWVYVFILGSLILILYLAMTIQLRSRVLESGLYYSIILRKDQSTWILRGFLDTGNQAQLDGLPVLFSSQIPIQPEREIQLTHVGSKVTYPVMKVDIYWQQQWQKAYIARLEHLELENADILLNLGLF